MEDKVCPMMSRPVGGNGGPAGNYIVHCLKEQCAWWGETAPGKGDCMIGIIALQLNHIVNRS